MTQTTDVMSVPKPEKVEKRFAIVGTAPSWRYTPWHDTGLTICGLNDGYLLGRGLTGQLALPREDMHYDLHPFHQMHFNPLERKAVPVSEPTVGAYLRPEGHLNWLKTRPFPVWVNQKPADWPAHVREFPRQELEAKYGTYFCSTPAWMIVHCLELGATSLEIYGINLATQYEYVAQRPNFEYWLRHAMDRGCKIVLPKSCPILKTSHVYAYEPKTDLPVQAAQRQIALVKQEGAQLQKELASLPFWAVSRKADLQSRLEVIGLELMDAKQVLGRAQMRVLAA